MFGFLIIILLVGIIVYQSRKIENLNAKIFRLQRELEQFKKNENIVKIEDKNVAEVQTIVKKNVSVETPKEKKVQEKVDPAVARNLSILITGSILIVLAAIVFFTTAWQSIPNFIKTIVLFLVAFVFLGASKLSREKYHLDKASKTFFYIGMAYLPICLLSISVFGLLGTYLSASGDGKYIYLGASTLILTVLYYFISKKSKDRYLFYGSVLSQILSVILFTLMFEERIFLVFVNLLLYNLLLMLMTKDKIFDLIIKIIPSIIAIGTITEIGDGSWYFIFTCLLLAINFICLELRKSNISKALLFNVFLFSFGFSLIFKESLHLSDGTCQFLATLFVGMAFLVENLLFDTIKEKKYLLMTSRIVTLCAMGFLYLGSLLETDKMIIPSYVMAFICEAFIVFDLKKSGNLFYKYLGYTFTNILFIDVSNHLLENMEFAKLIPMLTTTAIIFYEMLSNRKRDDVLPIYLTIFEAISLLAIGTEEAEVGVILAIIFSVFVLYYNKRAGINSMSNAVPLLCVLPCIVEAGLNEQFELGIMLLATIGLTYLSVNSVEMNIYTVISGIYLVITSGRIESEYFRELLYIVWSIMHVYFYQNAKSKDAFRILTAIFVTMLYYLVAEDLKLLEFTLFQLLGAVISGMYIIKNIISKYTKDVDILEYIFWTFIYLFALSNYADSRDGIIFSILILGVIFYSYYKKYGATFLAGIIAILVNGFALTRAFWLSIPWWIYLLVVGGSLIGFAIKNEANENKEKITVGSVLKGIKDKVEKD